MKHFDFTRLEKGKIKKVRLFGHGDSAFSPSLGKSKHHLNLKGKALAKARMKYNEHNKNLEDQEYNRNH